MNKTYKQSDQEQAEISLKELILKISGSVAYLRRKWMFILLAGIVGGLLGIGYSFVNKPKYNAVLTFVLEDAKGGGLGSYAGIASQLGIDLPMGNASSGIFAGDNIVEFLKSRLMVQNTLLSPMMANGKTVSAADYYIDVMGMREKMETMPGLKGIHFPTNERRETLSRQQDSVLAVLYKRIMKGELDVSKPDKKLSFVQVSYTGLDETFARFFTNRLVENATEFYIATKTQRSKTAVDNLQRKADSLLSELNRKTSAVATQQDFNINPARKVASVGVEIASRDKMVLQTMYAEVEKNLELSRTMMGQETPIIQIVDRPEFPLDKKKVGKVVGGLAGGIIASFICVMWLLGRNFYRAMMA